MKLLQHFLHVLRGRNSQARQQVLERVREAVVSPRKEKVVVIFVLYGSNNVGWIIRPPLDGPSDIARPIRQLCLRPSYPRTLVPWYHLNL